MDKDNYARLMREAADASAEKAKESLAFQHRQAFYDGMGFANKMRRDQTESLIKIRRIALAAKNELVGHDRYSVLDPVYDALSQILSLCSTTPAGEGG